MRPATEGATVRISKFYCFVAKKREPEIASGNGLTPSPKQTLVV
nr:MAG TPA: hypothetical protein [Caudoviricetes sp.]